jgi:hypothetical protein
VQQVIRKGGRIERLTMRSLITLPIAAPLVRAAAAMAARVPPDAMSGTAAPKTPRADQRPKHGAETLETSSVVTRWRRGRSGFGDLDLIAIACSRLPDGAS